METLIFIGILVYELIMWIVTNFSGAIIIGLFLLVAVQIIGEKRDDRRKREKKAKEQANAVIEETRFANMSDDRHRIELEVLELKIEKAAREIGKMFGFPSKLTAHNIGDRTHFHDVCMEYVYYVEKTIVAQYSCDFITGRLSALIICDEAKERVANKLQAEVDAEREQYRIKREQIDADTKNIARRFNPTH